MICASRQPPPQQPHARLERDRTIVLVPKYVALGKLAQAIIYGARVVMVVGNFDALRWSGACRAAQ